MFRLVASPTFTATVDIPIPGAGAEQVPFVFRHKTRDEVDALVDALKRGQSSVDDIVRDVVVEWKAKDVEFSEENLLQCFQIFPGSALAIWSAYRQALVEGKRKN